MWGNYFCLCGVPVFPPQPPTPTLFSSPLLCLPCMLFFKPSPSFMPKKMKSKQEVWIPISCFYIAGSVIPNVFFPSCRYGRNSLTETRVCLKGQLVMKRGRETLFPYDIDVCSGTLITHTLDQMPSCKNTYMHTHMHTHTHTHTHAHAHTQYASPCTHQC